MKRSAIALVVLLVVPVFAGPASAAERVVRNYRAALSDGQALEVRTVRIGDRRTLNQLLFKPRVDARGVGLRLTCEDGTTRRSTIAGYGAFGWEFDGHTITVDESEEDDYSALHLEGTFASNTASGTFRYTEASLSDDETTAHVCTTGDLTWTAELVS